MDKFIFALTGPTGAGKSTVSECFRKLGVYVADCDIAAKAVMQKGSQCLDEVRKNFGDEIFEADGELNRKALADIVFSNNDKLKLLNSVTHKYITRYITEEIAAAESEIAAIDGAVIIGSPVENMCRLTVVVTADKKIRIKRIMQRDKIDYISATERINAQMSSEEYESYADFTVKNNGDYVRLEECVGDLYSKIKAISKASGAATPSA